ncbi:3234_t:CDS:2 [Entrophospora sp. SA101]|nr:3234_t:CDS:2 [Entrophospora sp. SA101]
MSSSAVANLSSLKSDVDDINGKMGTMDIEDKEEMVMVEKDGEEEKKGGYEQQDIIMDDKQSHGPCFGDKDLWMKNNFNGYDSCSSDKDDYLDRVTTLIRQFFLLV